MTTNHPDKLDEALIRPGRVDMKVAFTMASRTQVRKIFTRMYTADTVKTSSKTANGHVHSAQNSLTAIQPKVMAKLTNGFAKKPNGIITPPSPSREKHISDEELQEIAVEFSQLVPESTFTPAEIQGFLLTRKKEPRRALEELPEWIKKSLEAKAAKLSAANGELESKGK
jgi:chaperone BCS1